MNIINKHRDKRGWKIIYFDGFAGSGRRGISFESSELLNNLFENNLLETGELSVYQGSAERVLSIDKRGFDFYYFIDIDKTSSSKLKQKLSPYEDNHTLVFRCDDANNQISNLAQVLKKDMSYKALILLDPFGMNIQWKSIEQLKGTGSDLWILIPTGVIVNRLLDKRGTLKNVEKLQSFFGLDKKIIEEYFYDKRVEDTLFGEHESIKKVKKPIEKIANIYINRLSTAPK